MANYPSAASTDANLLVAVNNLATALNGSLTASGDNTSGNGLRVVSTTGFPTAGFVTVELEVIAYTGISTYLGNPVFTGITRGSDGTTAASHGDGLAVSHFVIAAHHNVLKEEVKALEANLLPGQITGTATNDNAAAGKIGEYISSVVSAYANIGTSGHYADVTSLAVTAGDWDICGLVTLTLNSATSLSDVVIGIGTVPGDSSTGLVEGQSMLHINNPSSSENTAGSIPLVRASLAGNQTYYLKTNVNYTGGPVKALGGLFARRVR